MNKLNWILILIFSIVLFYQKCYIKTENLPCENCLYQDKMMNCGPTALKMVLTDLNININLSEIERATNFQKKAGVTLLDLYNYTKILGLKPNALRISENNLKNTPLPGIVFIKSKVELAIFMGGHHGSFRCLRH